MQIESKLFKHGYVNTQLIMQALWAAANGLAYARHVDMEGSLKTYDSPCNILWPVSAVVKYEEMGLYENIRTALGYTLGTNLAELNAYARHTNQIVTIIARGTHDILMPELHRLGRYDRFVTILVQSRM